MGFGNTRGALLVRARGSHQTTGMTNPKQEQESDRESLMGWTLVDREGTPEDPAQDETTTPPDEEEAQNEGEEQEGESRNAAEEDEEDGEEEESLPEELVTMGQRVQEIKEEGDVESRASTDISVLDGEGKEKQLEEETDLSLASSPSLPDDLPAIKPDSQYKHIPDKDLNSRLNVVVALTVACVLGLGIGHFLGWSSRIMWQENINSAQVIEALNTENMGMESEITRLQQERLAPIKIAGSEGKMGRDLRERINLLIQDNEELRLAIAKLQFANIPDSDKEAFNTALKDNYNLRISVSQLKHLGPNVNELKISANDLEAENQELQIQVGKLRYQQQPLPQELNAVAREVENLKRTVKEAYKQKKIPSGIENAKNYVIYMSQILSGIQTLHEFHEGSLPEKLEVATDLFENLVPGNIQLSPNVQQKMNILRSKFNEIRVSLSKKWDKVKDLSKPENIVNLGRHTLPKMNRVIVNVVNKMKEIGQTSILNRGKSSVDKTISILADRFSALDAQFEKTWNSLESETIAEKENDSEPVAEEEDDSTAATTEEVRDSGETGGKRADRTPRESKVEQEPTEENTKEYPSQSGRGGKRGGDGGDKKKHPEDKKNKDAVKEEKVEDENEEEKQNGRKKPQRSRFRSSDDKKEKKESKEKKNSPKKKASKEDMNKEKKEQKKDAHKKEKEMRKKDKDVKSEKKAKKRENEKARQKVIKENKRFQDKHSRGDDGKSENHQGDLNIQEKEKGYYKGQYNKYDKKQILSGDDDDDNNDDHRHGKKQQKKMEENEEQDNRHKKKYQSNYNDNDDDDNNEDDSKKGLMRHWQKPHKKNPHRDFSGPKKAFIRRHGKNQTQPYHMTYRQEQWMGKRGGGQEEQKSKWVFDRDRKRRLMREMNKKADWQFDQARVRRNKREVERVADWQFQRAHRRKEMRYVAEGKEGHFQDEDNDEHNHENNGAKRHYVRFDDDDDDDENHHYYNQKNRNKYDYRRKNNAKKNGQREWIIPNFSASGKTHYH